MNGKQFFDNPAALGASLVRGLAARITPPDRADKGMYLVFPASGR